MKVKRILCSLFFIKHKITCFWTIVVMMNKEFHNWGVASMTMEEDA